MPAVPKSTNNRYVAERRMRDVLTASTEQTLMKRARIQNTIKFSVISLVI
jgi:hypothetical protein